MRTKKTLQLWFSFLEQVSPVRVWLWLPKESLPFSLLWWIIFTQFAYYFILNQISYWIKFAAAYFIFYSGQFGCSYYLILREELLDEMSFAFHFPILMVLFFFFVAVVCPLYTAVIIVAVIVDVYIQRSHLSISLLFSNINSKVSVEFFFNWCSSCRWCTFCCCMLFRNYY